MLKLFIGSTLAVAFILNPALVASAYKFHITPGGTCANFAEYGEYHDASGGRVVSRRMLFSNQMSALEQERKRLTHAHDVIAESARGVSPRAAHRSGHEPLDSSGSCHRTKAAAFH